MSLSKIKRVTAVFLALILACSFTLPTFAAQAPESGIEPLWAGILTMDLTFSFSNGVGTATGSARKKSTASLISGLLIVYEQDGDDWIQVAEWSGSKTIGTLAMGGNFDSVRGETYKAVFTVTAYVNGVAEVETFEDIKTNNS
ncbi:MAG: hypothetical protein IJW49_02645 [Clostridia bacterium]|nr:hypothetical protein [Clostridia bacterium]